MSLELLQKYPKVAGIIRDWYMEKMVESLAEADEVDDEFKSFMRSQGVTNENVAPGIVAQPRSLFDVFDNNSIYISVMMTRLTGGDVRWQHVISYDDLNQTELQLFGTRKECEQDAVEQAFDILNKKL